MFRLTRALCLFLALCASAIACAGPPKKAETPPSATQESSAPEASTIGELVKGEPHTALSVEADDARLGSDQAAVTVVAFLDYQCGFCKKGFETLLSLRSAYSDDDLRIVFKHLPIESHEQAFPAAIVGQAVNQSAGSEAFFSFSRLAFSKQTEISYQAMAKWAEEAGVSREIYNEVVADKMTAQRVIQDVLTARKIGANATPTFYINGQLLAGAQPVEIFHQLIDEELKEMRASKASWSESYEARVSKNMNASLLEALLEQDKDDYLVPVDGSPIDGPPDADVTLVSFSDYECPFCKRAELTVQALKKKHGPSLRIVFKHLPLPFHDQARPAALLAAAAQKHLGDAGFYKVSAAIFESSPDLSEHALRSIGKNHGLTEEQIDSALDEEDGDLIERLAKDRELSDDVLARGTPHFFINGKRLSGARPMEQFDALIEHEKSRAAHLRGKGIAGKDIYVTLQKGALSPGAPQRIAMEIPVEARPSRGPEQAPIVVHIFSDFECPYCRRGEETLAKLVDLYPDQLRVIWHDYPLPFHENALPAARAAQEAYRQKGDAGFWKMHSLLFGLQGEEAAVGRSQILAHGKSIELDMNAFEKAIDSEDHDEELLADQALAEELGIRGTPAFVIDGYLVTGAKPLRFLQRVVEMSLKDQQPPTENPESPTP